MRAREPIGLPSNAPQLHEEAAVLNDVDARSSERLRRLVVPDPRLKPHRLRPLRDDVIDVCGDVAGSAKDIHQVDVPRDVGDASVDALPEDLRDVGIVHRDWDDVVAGTLRVLGHVEGGLSRLGRLDAEYGDSPRLGEDPTNACVVLYEMGAPLGGSWRSHNVESSGSGRPAS